MRGAQIKNCVVTRHHARIISHSLTLEAGTRVGAYEIIGALGAGGMGEVYRAKDSKLKREVALKVLPAAVANDGSASNGHQRTSR